MKRMEKFDESLRTTHEEAEIARTKIADLIIKKNNGTWTDEDKSNAIKAAMKLLDRTNTLLHGISLSLVEKTLEDPSIIRSGHEEGFIRDYKDMGLLTDEQEASIRSRLNL